MVDTWATVGSCAQIGKGVHLSGGAGIGGVLEPLQADPVIIGDGAFIGARAEVAEGVRVGEGAVLSMGVYLGRLDQDHRPRDGRGLPRRGAALFGGGAGLDRGWRRQTGAVLRGDREAGGRADAEQDQHQRTVAGLTHPSNPPSPRPCAGVQGFANRRR